MAQWSVLGWIFRHTIHYYKYHLAEHLAEYMSRYRIEPRLLRHLMGNRVTWNLIMLKIWEEKCQGMILFETKATHPEPLRKSSNQVSLVWCLVWTKRENNGQRWQITAGTIKLYSKINAYLPLQVLSNLACFQIDLLRLVITAGHTGRNVYLQGCAILKLLKFWVRTMMCVIVHFSESTTDTHYVCDGFSHFWRTMNSSPLITSISRF